MATDIKIRDMVKVYGRVPAVRGIDLDIPEGAFVAFVGPSGCGKTTTLRMIGGLETISHGELVFDGVKVNDLPSRERGVAMVFQSYALYPHMTVRENLEFSLKLEKLPKDEIRSRVESASTILELQDYLDRKPSALSGGQRQRVATGRAIVRNPKVFLFDEPLSNLDAKLRNQMRVEIRKIQRKLGVTTIYVTHDQIEAMTMADIIVVMRDGLVEQTGTPLEIFENPANKFVAGFIGQPPMNFIHAQVSGGKLKLDDINIDVTIDKKRFDVKNLDGEEVVVGLRAEHIVPIGQGRAVDKKTEFKSNVSFVEMLGNETLLFCNKGKVSFISRMYDTCLVQENEEIKFGIDVQRLHIFDKETGKSLDKEFSS